MGREISMSWTNRIDLGPALVVLRRFRPVPLTGRLRLEKLSRKFDRFPAQCKSAAILTQHKAGSMEAAHREVLNYCVDTKCRKGPQCELERSCRPFCSRLNSGRQRTCAQFA